MEIEPEEDHTKDVFLNDNWTLYFHDPNDISWDIQSYKQLYTVSSIEDFWLVYKTIPLDFWTKGMFFLMREHIQPVWEDPGNENGGCFSMKTMKQQTYDIWLHLSMRILGEDFTLNGGESQYVTGISISPKKTSSILRVWLSDNQYNDPAKYKFTNCPNYTDLLYKSHRGGGAVSNVLFKPSRTQISKS